MAQRRNRTWSAGRHGVEALEGRRLLAQFGVPWHDATHLSVSFVPDGTLIGDHGSDLFKALDAREPAYVWQQEILRAFQTWAVEARINFALVPDGGQPLGTPGPDQHDPRFGDIRIGTQPMSPEVLSISVPHDPFLSGTWSGDLLLNSSVAFDDGGADLFPVLLHEVGHVLGLDHSDDPASVMSEHLDNTKTTLAPSDIAAIQALYGPRLGDDLGGPAGNSSLATAAPFPTPTGFDGSIPLLLYGDVSTANQAEYFSLKPPPGYVGPATVRLQTAGVSLLAPRLTVYDATGAVVADISSSTETGDTLSFEIPQLAPDSTYDIEVRGARDDVFGIGEYALAVSFDARSMVSPSTIDTLARQSYSYLSPDDINATLADPRGVLYDDDHHQNNTFANETPLDPASGYGTEGPDRITASLGDPSDVDVYHVEAPESPAYSDSFGSSPGSDGPERPLVMTVTGRATEVNGLTPTLDVYDDNDQELVPATVLAHGDGTYTVQVSGVQPGEDYDIRVSADPSSGKIVGNYELDVEYGHEVAAPTTFVESTVSRPRTEESFALTVNQAQLFDFLLSAAPVPDDPGSELRMVVTDEEGQAVTSRVAVEGDTAGGDPVLLLPGSYRVTFAAESSDGGIPAPMRFRLYGASLSDPIGPQLDRSTFRTIVGPLPSGSTSSPPAIGDGNDPYTWLAISLSSSRGPIGTIASPAVEAGQPRRVASRLTDGPSFLSPLEVPPSSALASGRILDLGTLAGAGLDATLIAMAPGVPPQGPLFRKGMDLSAPGVTSGRNAGTDPIAPGAETVGAPWSAHARTSFATSQRVKKPRHRPMRISKNRLPALPNLQACRPPKNRSPKPSSPRGATEYHEEAGVETDLTMPLLMIGAGAFALDQGRRRRRGNAIATYPSPVA